VEKVPVNNNFFVWDSITEKLANINGVEDIEEWLKPTEKSLHDPYLLDNIQEVAIRIIRGIENNEKLVISGDCDSDGISSLAILVRYLNNVYDYLDKPNNLSYIYNQRSKGHGISQQEVPEDTELLIILDSSTNEVERCKELSERGISICAIDHHPKDVDNPYIILVNPQADNYPNKEISAAGLAFKLCQVMDDILDVEFANQFIDLAGIGIYADVMSMTEPESRYFVYRALKNITNPGIKAILDVEGKFIPYCNSQTIGFTIAPVVNAAARMEQIELIIELLLEDDPAQCKDLAKKCVKLNKERKQKEAKLFKKVKDRIDLSKNVIIVKTVEKDGIDKGFMGLLAGKIADRYKKPTLVVRHEEDGCAGSGRSVNNIPFKEILDSTGLCNFLSGHSGAFGVAFEEENTEQIFEAIKDNIIYEEDKIIEYDLELEEGDISLDLIKDVEAFNYLAGKNAQTSKFVIKELTVQEVKVMGKMLDTVKIVTDKLDLMKFRVNELYASELNEGDKIDIICTLNINRWYNFGIKQVVTTLQAFLEDYKLSEA
jgi:single-stranded-DNA-specific exonuclease